MRRGRRLGVDVGSVRIGVATCDPDGILATPVETVPAGPTAIARLVELGEEYEVLEFVVGLPRSLSGGEGPAARTVRDVAGELAAATTRPVRLVDERLSTVAAAGQLRAGGRNAKNSRQVIDQAAAGVILQNALDTERTRGEAPGALVIVEPPTTGAP